MVSPERPSLHADRELPRISKPEADLLISELLPMMPTRRAAKRVQELHEQSGSPVAVFLHFEDINPAADDIEQQFYGHYFGSFTRDEVIRTGLEFGEHDVALERFLDDQGLPEDALEWSFDALWPVMRERFFLVQEAHYFHVFDAVLSAQPDPSEETD